MAGACSPAKTADLLISRVGERPVSKHKGGWLYTWRQKQDDQCRFKASLVYLEALQPGPHTETLSPIYVKGWQVL